MEEQVESVVGANIQTHNLGVERSRGERTESQCTGGQTRTDTELGEAGRPESVTSRCLVGQAVGTRASTREHRQ